MQVKVSLLINQLSCLMKGKKRLQWVEIKKLTSCVECIDAGDSLKSTTA